MKKLLSVFLCVFSVLVFSSSALFSGSAYAETSPITWDDVSEDVIALRDSYYKLWSESSNFSELFKNASDIPLKWVTTLADGTAALSPFNGLLFSKTEEAHKVDYTGSSPKIKQMIDNGEITPEKPVISSEDFKTSLSEDSSKYSVKNSAGKISYRNDKHYQIGLWNVFYSPTFFFNGEFNSVSSSDGFYCVPFFTDGTTLYTGEYQMHFYFTTEYDYENKTAVKYLCLKMWKLVDGSEDEPDITYKSTADFDDYKYFFLNPVYKPNPWVDFYGFKSLSDFYKNTNRTQLRLANIPASYFSLLSPDFSQTLNFYDVWNSNIYAFKGTYETHDKSCSLKNDDVGFITSSSPLSSTYNFDINKISDGQLVTVTGGDTIYNYNITNPDTGESNTINEYVTNNYTYITNNGGEVEGSGGPGVGGNVTVGGQIDVGGSVGVDINVSVPEININVNGNGGAGDNVSLPDTDLVENLPEAPSGFIDYTASLFSFLPPEVLVLIIAAIAAAIFCRIWGR